MGRRVPADEWLGKEIDRLLDMTKGELPSPVAFVARSWTWLKLAVLDSYLPHYLRILYGRYRRLVFVDLFAGSGVSVYRDGNLTACTPSSSLVAASYARQAGPSFHHILAIEKDAGRAEAVAARLTAKGYGPERATVLKGDANQKVTEVAEFLKPRGTHALLFADPEGLDLHYATLQKILREHPATDIFVTHLATGAARQMNAALSPKLTSTYGGEDWRRCYNRQDFTDLYKRKLEQLRDIVFPIAVTGDFAARGYYYDLFFGARRTPRGSSWVEAVRALEPKVVSLTGQAVVHVLRTRLSARSAAGAKTRQQRLDEVGGTGPTSGP